LDPKPFCKSLGKHSLSDTQVTCQSKYLSRNSLSSELFPQLKGLLRTSRLYYHTGRLLVMEQTDPCKCHRHAVLIACLDHVVVTDRTARLSHILHSALMGALDIVSEREECIRTKRHIRQLIKPCPFLL